MKPLWQLRGEGVLLLRDWRSCIALVHYGHSPVGAYDEFAVIALTPGGPRVTQMMVTSEASKNAGRALWGFPKVLADLRWQGDWRRAVFRKHRQYFHLRAGNFSFPVAAKFWTIQTLDKKNVRVPFEVRGRARFGFRGKQLALRLEEFDMTVFTPIEI